MPREMTPRAIHVADPVRGSVLISPCAMSKVYREKAKSRIKDCTFVTGSTQLCKARQAVANLLHGMEYFTLTV